MLNIQKSKNTVLILNISIITFLNFAFYTRTASLLASRPWPRPTRPRPGPTRPRPGFLPQGRGQASRLNIVATITRATICLGKSANESWGKLQYKQGVLKLFVQGSTYKNIQRKLRSMAGADPEGGTGGTCSSQWEKRGHTICPEPMRISRDGVGEDNMASPSPLPRPVPPFFLWLRPRFGLRPQFSGASRHRLSTKNISHESLFSTLLALASGPRRSTGSPLPVRIQDRGPRFVYPWYRLSKDGMSSSPSLWSLLHLWSQKR